MLREIGVLRTDMIGAIADLETSMIKWMVGLMVGQLGLILVVGDMLWGKRSTPAEPPAVHHIDGIPSRPATGLPEPMRWPWLAAPRARDRKSVV